MTVYLKASITDEFYQNFAEQPSKIDGQPNYEDIRRLHQTL